MSKAHILTIQVCIQRADGTISIYDEFPHMLRYEEEEEYLEALKYRLPLRRFDSGPLCDYECLCDVLNKPKMRQRAECLLQLCSRKKSLDKAIDAMQEELEIKRSAVDRVIKKLKGLGLNPITIPIRRHAEPLPSLLTLLG